MLSKNPSNQPLKLPPNLRSTTCHKAECHEQEAKGCLERQKIDDESEAEKSCKMLLHLQATVAVVESTGQASAEAKARAEGAIAHLTTVTGQ